MPSAVKKSDKKHDKHDKNQTDEDPFKLAILLLERKVKFLEKKRAKLDSFRTHISTLTPAERDSLARYEEVVACAEQAKELQDQLTEIFQKSERLSKTKQKNEQNERQKQETTRYQEILRLQGLLDTLGVEEIREDFMKGLKGALQLTDTDLKQLDAFYQLINPTRDGEKAYKDKLAASATHLSNYLQLKDKPVVGSTYRKLKELTKRIAVCPYFDPNRQKEEDVPSAEVEIASQDNTQPASEAGEETIETKEAVAEEEAAAKQPETKVETPQMENADKEPAAKEAALNTSSSTKSPTDQPKSSAENETNSKWPALTKSAAKGPAANEALHKGPHATEPKPKRSPKDPKTRAAKESATAPIKETEVRDVMAVGKKPAPTAKKVSASVPSASAVRNQHTVRKHSHRIAYLPPAQNGPARPIAEVLASFQGPFEFLQESEVDSRYNTGTITEPPTEAKSTPEVNNLGSAVVTPSFTSAEAFKSASGITFEGAALVEDKDAQAPKKASQPPPSKIIPVTKTSAPIGPPIARPPGQPVAPVHSSDVHKPVLATASKSLVPMSKLSTTGSDNEAPPADGNDASAAAPVPARASTSKTNLIGEDTGQWVTDGEQSWASTSSSWTDMAHQPTWGEESQWAENGTDGPPPIPMPGQALNSYKGDAKEKTNSALNPNANIFNSVYNNQGSTYNEYESNDNSDTCDDGSNDQFMTVSYHSRNSGRGGRRGNRNRDSDHQGNTSGARSSGIRNYERHDRNYERNDRNYERNDRNYERNDRGGYYQRGGTGNGGGGSNYNNYRGNRGNRSRGYSGSSSSYGGGATSTNNSHGRV